VAFSPDGRWIATGNASDLVIWDATTGVERFRRPAPGNHDLPLLSLAYSPDGRRIIAGYGRFNDTRYVGFASLWDAVTAKALIDRIPSMLPALPIGRAPDAVTAEVLIDRIPRYRAGVHSVAFSPDGREVALASVGLVELWDLQATPKPVRALPGHIDFVWQVAYSPDGRLIATACRDTTVRLWDRATGNEIRPFYGHEGFVRGLAFSPDSRLLISASEDRSLKLWEVASGRPLAAFHGHQSSTSCVAFSPDGRLAVSGGKDHAVKLWRATSSPQLTFTGHDGFVNGLAFSPDGQRIVSGAGSHSTRGLDYVMRWDATTGEPLEPSFKGCPEVWSVALHPDGRRLATACRDPGPVMVWDIDTGRLVWAQKGQAIDVFDVAYSPDGRWLASGGGNSNRPHGEVKLWDAETGREIRTFVVHTAAVFGVAISPDSRWLAAGCADGMVRIWDTRDPASKAREPGRHIGTVERVVFLPDGRLASAGGTEAGFGEVKIWDLATGRVLDLRGHTDQVWGLASSPDGRRLATGCNDRTIKLWDTATGEEVFTLRGHMSGVIRVAFSRDGRRIASGSWDRTVRVWDTKLPAADTLSRRGAEARASHPELPDNPFAP
jgi:WD40 repeat protein